MEWLCNAAQNAKGMDHKNECLLRFWRPWTSRHLRCHFVILNRARVYCNISATKLGEPQKGSHRVKGSYALSCEASRHVMCLIAHLRPYIQISERIVLWTKGQELDKILSTHTRAI